MFPSLTFKCPSVSCFCVYRGSASQGLADKMRLQRWRLFRKHRARFRRAFVVWTRKQQQSHQPVHCPSCVLSRLHGCFLSPGSTKNRVNNRDGKTSYWLGDSKGLCRLKKKKKHRHKTQIIHCYKALFTQGQFLHFIAVCKRLPDVRPISIVLQTSSQAAFY